MTPLSIYATIRKSKLNRRRANKKSRRARRNHKEHGDFVRDVASALDDGGYAVVCFAESRRFWMVEVNEVKEVRCGSVESIIFGWVESVEVEGGKEERMKTCAPTRYVGGWKTMTMRIAYLRSVLLHGPRRSSWTKRFTC